MKMIFIERKTILFFYRTLDFGEFLLLLASHQNEEQDDYDELNLAFQLFDSGIEIFIYSDFSSICFVF